jgi:creatinine amidohydrolase
VQIPDNVKAPIDRERMALMTPAEVRTYVGDGNFAGRYQRSDEDMASIWSVAVAETRRLLEGPWL